MRAHRARAAVGRSPAPVSAFSEAVMCAARREQRARRRGPAKSARQRHPGGSRLLAPRSAAAAQRGATSARETFFRIEVLMVLLCLPERKVLRRQQRDGGSAGGQPLLHNRRRSGNALCLVDIEDARAVRGVVARDRWVRDKAGGSTGRAAKSGEVTSERSTVTAATLYETHFQYASSSSLKFVFTPSKTSRRVSE